MSDSSSRVDRRTFLGQSARVTGGAAIASTALSYARILGANDRIQPGRRCSMNAIPTRLSSCRRPFDKQARVGLACAALSLGLAASAFAWRPVDGGWRGNTMPSRLYNFTVLAGGTIINPLNLGWSVCGGGSTTLSSDIPISASNTFSTNKNYFDNCPTLTTSGTFTSPTTATGTLTVTFVKGSTSSGCPCGGTQTLAWNSSKIPPQADLTVTKTDGKSTIVAGTTDVYTMIVTNNGPEPVTSLTLRDTLPAALLNPVFVPSSGTYDAATEAWTGLNLGAGQGVALTLTATVSPSASTSLTNRVTVLAPAGLEDPNPNNNQATDVTTPLAEADLAITKTGPSLLTTPSGVTWRLAVTNNGPSDASLVQVQDTTPAGLTFVSTSGACATAFPCSLATVPAGQTRTIDASFAVPADYAGPNPISNTATLTTSTTDPDLTDNTATATIQVVPPAPASHFFTIEPCRLLDTRAATGPYGGPALVAGADRTFVATGPTCGIPATATAVSVNVAVTAPTVAGNLRLYPADYPLPQTSTINYIPGLTRANNAIVALNGSGEFTIRCSQGAGTAHAIVDVNGYFE